jgi:hypothetical protein
MQASPGAFERHVHFQEALTKGIFSLRRDEYKMQIRRRFLLLSRKIL